MQWASSITSRPALATSCGQLLVPEARVVQPLGETSSTSTVSAASCCWICAHSQLVGRIDGGGPHAGAFGSGHLVAHQRQQRRDDQRGTGAPAPQQQARHEVDRRFAPAGALHHQCPASAGDERLHGLELALVELRRVMAHQGPQQRRGLLTQRTAVRPGRRRFPVWRCPWSPCPLSRRSAQPCCPVFQPQLTTCPFSTGAPYKLLG